MDTEIEIIESPLGLMELCASEAGLVSVTFLRRRKPSSSSTRKTRNRRSKILRESAALFNRYFRGDFAALDKIKLDLRGTPFQKKVWQAAQRIRANQYRSYSEIARLIGKPRASRAVGQALHVNPLAIVVPCHRVVGKTGRLTGYAGGLDTKKSLLEHEGVVVSRASVKPPQLRK